MLPLSSCCSLSTSIPSVSGTSSADPLHVEEEAGEKQRSKFSYNRASPSVRWPELGLRDPDKVLDWITLSKEVDAEKANHAANAAHPAGDTGYREDVIHNHVSSPQPRKIAGFTPSVNPYIGARGEYHLAMAAQSSGVASVIEPKARARRENGKLIKLSRLALIKAKDWRERVHRLSEAILKLRVGDSVADLLKHWDEQLAATDMCIVLKRVGDENWQRALELYEWYNVKHWYEPNSRMLASMLSILGRVHQVHIAKEIFDRAEPSVGNSVQVYNAMMGVYARQGDCNRVQMLLNLMKERGCDLDLITYNTVINARCKAGLMPGIAMQLLQDMKKDRLMPDVITYNTLISACASRNDCAEAELIYKDMQNSMCEPDLWTYNALISLYGRTPGKEARAIDYFHTLQRQGLVPDAVTFNAVLYAYAKTGRINEFDDVRSKMKFAGCRADEITYNTMISMYGKLSQYEKALSSYHEMIDGGCRPDAVTYTVLIDMLGKAGKVNEAEEIFQEMSDMQVLPTLQAFSAMIYAYMKAGKTTEAHSTFDCMIRTGIVPDHRAMSLILEVLQKAELPQKAMLTYQKAIRRGFVPDLEIYGILLKWFSEVGRVKDVDIVAKDLLSVQFSYTDVCITLLNARLPQKACELLLSVMDQGSNVDEELVIQVLQSLGNSAKFNEAQSLVDSFNDCSPEGSFKIKGILLTMLAEAKQVLAVKNELDKLRLNGLPLSLDAYRTLIKMFEDTGMLEQILLISSDMQLFGIEMDETCKKSISKAYTSLSCEEQDHVSSHRSISGEDNKASLDTYISLIEEYGKQKLWERAEGAFRELRQAGHRPSVKAWNTLISAYAVCGEYDNAKLAVAEMIADGRTPTSHTCTIMLQAVINADRTKEICNVLQEMRQYGVNPNKNVFLELIDSFANKSKGQEARAIFSELKSAGYFPNMQVYRSLILLFSKLKRIREAESMIKEMQLDGFTPDIIIYNSMITLYGKLGHFQKAAEMFREMQAAGCSPDTYTFNSLIWIFSKCLKVQEALGIVQQMQMNGFAPDADSYTALISACGRLQMIEAADALFKNANESGCQLNSKVFHALMNVYRSAGQPEKVRRLIEDMKAVGFEPTLGTFHILMDSYAKGGDPKQAAAIIENMFETGLSPGIQQYGALIDAYLKNKEYDLAIEKLVSIVKKGYEPDFKLWTSMIVAASHCKESITAVALLNALRDVGFSLPLRLLTERNAALFCEYDQTLQSLESSGEEAGLGLSNAILDLLWAFQMHGTAAKLFMVAIERKLYPSTIARVLVKDWSADFRKLSAGAALIALTLWLDQMQDAALQGFPEVPKIVTLTTGVRQFINNQTSVEKTVKVHLWTMGSPFLRSGEAGVFKAKGYSLCHWLKDSPHCMDLKLRNFSVLPEFNTMEVHNGAFMLARLVPALQQIEQSIGELRPKKFRKLIHLTQMQRSDAIAAELKTREDMMRKGLLDDRGKRRMLARRRLRKRKIRHI
ncbi:hypothetical protein KP509_36G032400 [Ceratopteris richardii]|uniref:PROP1-like PPR domain-containing protein n=1 Tax=Ceratopteris richardii TaxID=49495 RepID=A0A8T2QBS5_CERRI|nr:hypothetical protein KP509_36G032400 [Ceratopteris richardii]